MMIDPVALKSELDTDPSGLGYAPHLASGDNKALVGLLNESRAASPVFRGLIPAHEIVSATEPGDWAGLSVAEQRRYIAMSGAGQIDVTSPNVRSAFAAMFGAGTTTRSNLVALARRDGSRIEELFGVGLAASLNDVREAING